VPTSRAEVICRDVRTMAPVWRARRRAPTHQRLRFALSADERLLVTPSHDARVLTYAIADGAAGVDGVDADVANPSMSLHESIEEAFAGCCVNSVDCHPTAAPTLVVVGTGERAIRDIDATTTVHKRVLPRNSISLWRLS
jgi:hypothetical protein